VADARIELLLPPGLTPKPAGQHNTGCLRAGTAGRYVCPIGALPAGGEPQLVEIYLAGGPPLPGHARVEAKLVSADPATGPYSNDGHHWVQTGITTQ